MDGTTEMIKYLIPAFLVVVFVASVFNPARPYWARVGWEMDRTLNPCKYTSCATTSTEVSP